MVVLWWFYGGSLVVLWWRQCPNRLRYILSFMFNKYYICDVILQCLLLGVFLVGLYVSFVR